MTGLDVSAPLSAEVERMQETIRAWQSVYETIEAYLQDRIRMRDELNPETCLSIIQHAVRDVARDSEQYVASRWHDYRRLTDQATRAEAERDAAQASAERAVVMSELTADERHIGVIQSTDQHGKNTRVGVKAWVETAGRLTFSIYIGDSRWVETQVHPDDALKLAALIYSKVAQAEPVPALIDPGAARNGE